MTLQQSVSLPVAGLVTDPGPFTSAPDGALVEAENVVSIRPGVIEPRVGGLWFVDTTLRTANAVIHASFSDAEDNAFVWGYDGSAWLIRRPLVSTITGPATFTRGKIRVCPTGGRALFTSDDGVCSLPLQTASPTAGSDVIAYRAGLFQPYIPIVSMTTTGRIPNNTVVAYRFTVRRTLADGTVVESPPSRRLLAVNTTGANAGFFFSGPITPTDPYRGYNSPIVNTNGFGDYTTGDLLCVYRAPSTTQPTLPSDEMKLRATVPWDDTFKAFVDPENAPAPWRDDLPDGEWNGGALYTNETQEGAAFANYRPEYARDIALYNGMTFYAGALTPHRVVLRNVATGTNDESVSFSYRQITVSYTAGSNIVTGLSAAETRQVRVGQVVSGFGQDPEAAGVWPARTYIASISPGISFTTSANATATAVGAQVEVFDWVEADDGTNKIRLYARGATQLVPFASALAVDFRAFWNNRAYADAEQEWNGKFTSVGVYNATWRGIQLRVEGEIGYSIGGVAGGCTDGVWTFTRTDGTDTAFTVRSSCPEAWDKDVTYDVGVASKRDGGVAELQWSKVNEPEHCPLPYRTVVGDSAYAIRRIIPARSSLIILKDDGLYQCYGQTPDSLSFELLDRTITLPAPLTYDEQSKWVDRFDDRIVAMTTRGPMVIGDAGGEVIGAPILESLRRSFASSFGAMDDALRALIVDVTGRRVGFVWNVGSPATAVAYVVDMEAGLWTYWTWRRQIGAASVRTTPSAGSAALGTASTYGMGGGYLFQTPYTSRTMLDDASVTLTTMPPTYETLYGETCTVSAVGSSSPYDVAINAGSEWTPTVGDLLIQGSNSFEVVSVSSATVFQTIAAPAFGASTWREGFPCRVVWAARSEGNVGTEKSWIRVSLPFELCGLTAGMKKYVKGYRNNNAASETRITPAATNGDSPWTLRPAFKPYSVPAGFAKDWAIKLGFSITRAGCWFSTAGISVLVEAAEPETVSR